MVFNSLLHRRPPLSLLEANSMQVETKHRQFRRHVKQYGAAPRCASSASARVCFQDGSIGDVGRKLHLKKVGWGKKADLIQTQIEKIEKCTDGRRQMWEFMKQNGFEQPQGSDPSSADWDQWEKWNVLGPEERTRKMRKLDEEAKEKKITELFEKRKKILHKSKISNVDLWLRNYYDNLCREISECWSQDASIPGASRTYNTHGGAVRSFSNELSFPDFSTLKTPNNTIHAQRLEPNALTQAICNVVKLSSDVKKKQKTLKPPAHIDLELCQNRENGTFVVVKRGTGTGSEWWVCVGCSLNPYRVYMVRAVSAEKREDETKISLRQCINVDDEMILGGSRNGDWWQYEIFFGEVSGSLSVSVVNDWGVIKPRKPKKKEGGGEGCVKSEVRFEPLRSKPPVEREEKKADDRI